MVVYLARDISAFIMYCVYGESHSSLLIESTDSMIIIIMSFMAHHGIDSTVLYRSAHKKTFFNKNINNK